jgi:hypothetical protein
VSEGGSTKATGSAREEFQSEGGREEGGERKRDIKRMGKEQECVGGGGRDSCVYKRICLRMMFWNSASPMAPEASQRVPLSVMKWKSDLAKGSVDAGHERMNVRQC